jgi:hypothetical protein
MNIVFSYVLVHSASNSELQIYDADKLLLLTFIRIPGSLHFTVRYLYA